MNLLKILGCSEQLRKTVNSVFPRARWMANTTAKLQQAQEQKQGLILSEACVAKLKKRVGGGEMLRVTVDGGGCSGFQYKFDLDDKVNSDDVVFEKDGAKVVTDVLSLSFLDGATIDYQEELIRASFRVIENPQAGKGCSCGASFAPKGM